MLVRFVGDQGDVAGAAEALRSALAAMDEDPAITTVREAWQSSPAWGTAQ